MERVYEALALVFEILHTTELWNGRLGSFNTKSRIALSIPTKNFIVLA